MYNGSEKFFGILSLLYFIVQFSMDQPSPNLWKWGFIYRDTLRSRTFRNHQWIQCRTTISGIFGC